MFNSLKGRLTPFLFDKRMGRQKHHQSLQFRGGFRVFWENIDLVPSILKVLLHKTGLLKEGFKNALDYQVVHHRIRLMNLPASFRGFTILQLSDLHIDGIIDNGQRLIERIRELSYDLCVFTGDFRFLTYGQFHETITLTKKIMEAVGGREHPLGVLGNHDFIEMVPALENMGIQMLLNESVVIERGNERIGIAGVDDSHFYGTDNIDRAIEGIADAPCKILLAHSLEGIPQAAKKGINYYMCGHTHGGQLCLPGGVPVIINSPLNFRGRFVKGAWVYRDMHGYTCRGAGSSGLPVRYNCPPEITLHTFVLKFKPIWLALFWLLVVSSSHKYEIRKRDILFCLRSWL